MQDIINWYALYTKPRQEFIAEEMLLNLDIEVYLPKIIRFRKWSDRKKKIVEPLFKSYIFIRCDERKRSLACTFSPIVKTIFFNGKPSVIPPEQIENLKALLEKTNDLKVIEGIVKGTVVKIVDGPFSGIQGIVFSETNNDSMLAVSIELLNRTVIVHLPKNSLVKIAS